MGSSSACSVQGMRYRCEILLSYSSDVDAIVRAAYSIPRVHQTRWYTICIPGARFLDVRFFPWQSIPTPRERTTLQARARYDTRAISIFFDAPFYASRVCLQLEFNSSGGIKKLTSNWQGSLVNGGRPTSIRTRRWPPLMTLVS